MKLLPKLEKIKENYDGADAHKRIMALYKEFGVSPFLCLSLCSV